MQLLFCPNLRIFIVRILIPALVDCIHILFSRHCQTRKSGHNMITLEPQVPNLVNRGTVAMGDLEDLSLSLLVKDHLEDFSLILVEIQTILAWKSTE